VNLRIKGKILMKVKARVEEKMKRIFLENSECEKTKK